jgi:hypothetical protein
MEYMSCMDRLLASNVVPVVGCWLIRKNAKIKKEAGANKGLRGKNAKALSKAKRDGKKSSTSAIKLQAVARGWLWRPHCKEMLKTHREKAGLNKKIGEMKKRLKPAKRRTQRTSKPPGSREPVEVEMEAHRKKIKEEMPNDKDMGHAEEDCPAADPYRRALSGPWCVLSGQTPALVASTTLRTTIKRIQ